MQRLAKENADKKFVYEDRVKFFEKELVAK